LLCECYVSNKIILVAARLVTSAIIADVRRN